MWSSRGTCPHTLPQNHNRKVTGPEPVRLSDFCCQGGPPPRPHPAGKWKRRGGGSGQGQAGPQVPLPSCPTSLPGFGGSISPGSIPHHIPEPAHRAWHVWAPQSPGLTSLASLPGAGPAWPLPVLAVGTAAGRPLWWGVRQATCASWRSSPALMGRRRPAGPRACHPVLTVGDGPGRKGTVGVEEGGGEEAWGALMEPGGYFRKSYRLCGN